MQINLSNISSPQQIGPQRGVRGLTELVGAGDMPPTSGPGFCKYVASKGAAVLFDANAAAKMPTGGFERAAGRLLSFVPKQETQKLQISTGECLSNT